MFVRFILIYIDFYIVKRTRYFYILMTLFSSCISYIVLHKYIYFFFLTSMVSLLTCKEQIRMLNYKYKSSTLKYLYPEFCFLSSFQDKKVLNVRIKFLNEISCTKCTRGHFLSVVYCWEEFYQRSIWEVKVFI